MPQPYPYPVYYPLPPQTLPAQEIKKEPLAAAKIEPKPEEKKPEEKKPEEKKPEVKNKKPAMALTNEYIKSLENNLNNKDKAVRGKAIAELVNRFKEDKSRKDNKQLTKLLNLALDTTETKPNVLGAMQALENGYANGDATTVQRLQAIRDQHDNFGNSETAEGILTKLAGRTPADKNAATPIKEAVETQVPKLDTIAG
jgi:hypothetical protein